MSDEVVIRAKDVSKQYRIFDKPVDRLKEALHPFGKRYHTEFFALRKLSLEVPKGESLAIIGRNGSGKSTLLKLITGVISPTEGRMDVKGRVAALLELGAGFNPEYTGVENVYLNGTMQGYSRKELDGKMSEILSFADIGDFAQRPCKTYSSGMFARLAFAAMLHFEPDVFIVDEALAVGDVFFQQKCFRWMKEKMTGVTRLLVSHDMASVAQLATRAIVLERGEITFEGEPLKAIEHYTKTLHTEIFANPHAEKVEGGGPAPAASFNPIEADALGGAGEVKFTGWQLEITNEGKTSPVAEMAVIRTGDRVRATLEMRSERAVEHLLVGVSVNDRFGQNVFGVNSLNSGHRLTVGGPGTHVITLEFAWPEIKEGRYTLTFGLGEGDDELHHVIQCWAHNVVAVDVLRVRPVHGIFNVHMDRVSIT